MKLRKLSILNKSLIGICILVILFITGALTYKVLKSQGVAEEIIVNEKITSPKLVIATQKSKFKEIVTEKLIDELKTKNIQIHVIDVTQLFTLKKSDWDGIIIFTTVESGKIQKDSHEFLTKYESNKDKILLLYTADSNKWKHKDIEIDAIASASKIKKTNDYLDEILVKALELTDKIKQ